MDLIVLSDDTPAVEPFHVVLDLINHSFTHSLPAPLNSDVAYTLQKDPWEDFFCVNI